MRTTRGCCKCPRLLPARLAPGVAEEYESEYLLFADGPTGVKEPMVTYRAVDRYVAERVPHFLRRRHKVSSRGTKRYPAGPLRLSFAKTPSGRHRDYPGP